MFNRAPLLLLIALLVTGCAGLQREEPPQPLPDDISELQRWQARGRLAVSAEGQGGSGSFEWLQRRDASDIQIRGPVGIGGVRLQLQGPGAQPDLVLETSDGHKVESDAAWAELQARLGAAVPAGHLRYWLLGVAAPGDHQWLEPTSPGVVSLAQDGWRIDYQRFTDEPGLRVPLRMNASSGDARVRIIIDRWRLGQ